MPDWEREWLTTHELNYLRNLGLHRDSGRFASNRIRPDLRPWRLQCLRGYVRAASSKPERDWGRIDPFPCVQYAIDEIARIEAGGEAFPLKSEHYQRPQAALRGDTVKNTYDVSRH